MDDSATVRKVLHSLLTKAGYEVEEADSGGQALEMIESSLCYDVITLDVKMSGLDGFETCKRIRELSDPRKASVPIVFITGNDTLEGRTKGFEMGASDFLSKENIMLDILPIIDRIARPELIYPMRALVVDDSKVARGVIVGVLREIFESVEEAEDGRAAFELLKERGGDFDFVITDSEMPKMTGEELTKCIRKDLGMKHIPIMLVTGTKDRGRILAFFKAHGTDCLMKPVIKEEFLARIVAHVEREKNASALREYSESLRKLNEEKDAYLAACSHDLKTPLHAIVGFTELVEEELDDPVQKNSLSKVLEAAGDLQMMIDNILELYRVQTEERALDLEPVDIKQILSECLSVYSVLFDRKGIQLKIEGGEAGTLILGESLSLKRIFNNLLSNAVKFTHPGGSCEVTVNSSDSQVWVEVRDTGTGMDPETVTQLFQSYAKKSRMGTKGEAGTGLGMLITQQLVAKHQGRIEVVSEAGQGTTFKVYFPKSGKSVRSSPSAA